MRIQTIVAAVLLSLPARAQEAQVKQAPQLPQRDYVNLRAGASTSSLRPEICMEVSPIERLGLEACGTGSGFLHKDPAPEIAHFRAKVNLDGWETRVGFFQPQLFAGFAELQMGEDDEGFHFTSTGPRGVETAGPEVGAAVRALYPVGAGFELVGTLNLSLSYFSHAPELIAPRGPWQPALSFTVGAGF